MTHVLSFMGKREKPKEELLEGISYDSFEFNPKSCTIEFKARVPNRGEVDCIYYTNIGLYYEIGGDRVLKRMATNWIGEQLNAKLCETISDKRYTNFSFRVDKTNDKIICGNLTETIVFEGKPLSMRQPFICNKEHKVASVGTCPVENYVAFEKEIKALLRKRI
jgi:hypothetical protein